MIKGLDLTAAQIDRACGVLVGAATGDALGAGYEFGSAPLVGSPAMIGGGLGNFEPGEWTDDTAQTNAIGRVALTGADLRHPEALDRIAAGFAQWYAGHPPDIGNQTRHVLSSVGPEATAAEMTAAASALHARTGHTAGNGSLMRTASVALAHLDDEIALVQAAMAVSALTHADPVAGEACALWCLAIRHSVLVGAYGNLRDGLVHLPATRRSFWRDRIDEAEQRDPNIFNGNGYVVTALQAAWLAITHTPVPADEPAAGSFPCAQFANGLETAIRIGHDTDTVASIAGALLGARWGVSGIPSAWRELLHGWPGGTAADLVTVAVLTVRGGLPYGDGWPGLPRVKYPGWVGMDTLVQHPSDPGVWLGGVGALDNVPSEVTAVVSLCRVGQRQVPAGLRHVDFRLIDTDEADNPNLAYVIDDAARAVARLRDAGETVLLHCVAAQSRTPTVAARYAVVRGVPPGRAASEIVTVLPAASPTIAMRHALGALNSSD